MKDNYRWRLSKAKMFKSSTYGLRLSYGPVPVRTALANILCRWCAGSKNKPGSNTTSGTSDIRSSTKHGASDTKKRGSGLDSVGNGSNAFDSPSIAISQDAESRRKRKCGNTGGTPEASSSPVEEEEGSSESKKQKMSSDSDTEHGSNGTATPNKPGDGRVEGAMGGCDDGADVSEASGMDKLENGREEVPEKSKKKKKKKKKSEREGHEEEAQHSGQSQMRPSVSSEGGDQAAKGAPAMQSQQKAGQAKKSKSTGGAVTFGHQEAANGRSPTKKTESKTSKRDPEHRPQAAGVGVSRPENGVGARPKTKVKSKEKSMSDGKDKKVIRRDLEKWNYYHSFITDRINELETQVAVEKITGLPNGGSPLIRAMLGDLLKETSQQGPGQDPVVQTVHIMASDLFDDMRAHARAGYTCPDPRLSAERQARGRDPRIKAKVVETVVVESQPGSSVSRDASRTSGGHVSEDHQPESSLREGSDRVELCQPPAAILPEDDQQRNKRKRKHKKSRRRDESTDRLQPQAAASVADRDYNLRLPHYLQPPPGNRLVFEDDEEEEDQGPETPQDRTGEASACSISNTTAKEESGARSRNTGALNGNSVDEPSTPYDVSYEAPTSTSAGKCTISLKNNIPMKSSQPKVGHTSDVTLSAKRYAKHHQRRLQNSVSNLLSNLSGNGDLSPGPSEGRDGSSSRAAGSLGIGAKIKSPQPQGPGARTRWEQENSSSGSDKSGGYDRPRSNSFVSADEEFDALLVSKAEARKSSSSHASPSYSPDTANAKTERKETRNVVTSPEFAKPKPVPVGATASQSPARDALITVGPVEEVEIDVSTVAKQLMATLKTNEPTASSRLQMLSNTPDRARPYAPSFASSLSNSPLTIAAIAGTVVTSSRSSSAADTKTQPGLPTRREIEMGVKPPPQLSDSHHHKNLRDCPNLSGTLAQGDVIAFKILELGEDYTPVISDYKRAVVLEVDTARAQLELALCEEKKKRHGRFELDEDEDVCDPSSLLMSTSLSELREVKFIGHLQT